MEYSEFRESVKNSVSMLFKGDEVIIRKVLKNNGVVKDSLSIISERSNVSPTVYLDSYYEAYKREEMDIQEIASEIYDMYQENLRFMNFNVDLFKNFETVKEKVVYKLINAKTNEELLKDVPHVDVIDLAMVFYCLMDDEIIGGATALIHNVHMEMWNVTVDDLFNVARKNTPNLLKCELKSMDDVIREIVIEHTPDMVRESSDSYILDAVNKDTEELVEKMVADIRRRNPIEMYVLTNEIKLNGAACMMYEDVLDAFSRKMGNNIYIIPSSIHEVLLVPEFEGICEEELTNMVREVNKCEVDDVDVLSDHVYYYDHMRKSILLSKAAG